MAELIAKTSSAVSVDEDLTTLIDWVNIESLAEFTIVIDNVGGGSAHPITDVQIDTSVDGGVTVLTDQHAGVPAVPIVAAKASVGTFTETAAYVRVRAQCAADQDTTVTAILTADSVTARICSLADVKDRLVISDSGHDTVISRIISGLTVLFETHCDRPLLLNAADATEYYTGRGQYLQLKRYPVVSITSIKESLTYDFDGATAMIANEDYRLLKAGLNGIVCSLLCDWSNVPDSIQFIYKGGYCSAGQTPGDSEYAMPADLREAAIEQSSFIFKRKDDIGLAGVSFEGGGLSKFSAMDLLPMVRKVLDSYRRVSL